MKRLLLSALISACLCGAAFGQTVAQTTVTPIVIVTGNTFQNILSAVTLNNQRRSLTIQNNNATDNCWVYPGAFGSATKATAILLLPGGSYTRYYPYIPSDIISATCASSSDTLYVDNQ